MSETLDNRQPEYEHEGVLTEEERIDVLERSDHGITPAPMVTFNTLREFQAESGNFHAHFTSPVGSLAAAVYRSKKALARCELVKPDLNEELQRRLEAKGPFFAHRDRHAWVPLFLAYDAMSRLVDVEDDMVVRDGQVFKKYLCE
jgi:hypothetical protein